MIKPKKKNLFKFFKSNEFNEARIKMCAMYIILSYANELHEDIDRLLKGFDGLYIGDLKHASKVASKALEDYDRQYMAHIGSDGTDLCDATIDVTSQLDIAIQQSKFFLQEGSKALRFAIDTQIRERVVDEEQLEKESQDDFEICGEEERNLALQHTLKITKQRIDELHGDVLKGVEIGFNTAINWINRLYRES